MAFNSQRLHEACKAKGVLELHLLQKEAAQLKTKYQASLPPDEMTVRQIQHNQFHVNPTTQKTMDLNAIYCALKMQTDAVSSGPDVGGVNGGYYGKTAAENLDMSARQYKGGDQSSAIPPTQKAPLQQQLMQHRLLQQKRQILQKQVAMEAALNRRQMLRQPSYKIAQQQQILPPLPLPLQEHESEDLLAFQAIVEGPISPNTTPTPSLTGSPKLMKTSHIQQNDCWNTLSGSMQTCQINDNGSFQHHMPHQHHHHEAAAAAAAHWGNHQNMYQVFSMNE